jgi:hypothetical protein
VSREAAAGLMKGFCKQEECPTSEELVARSEQRVGAYILELEEHLKSCDFCAAEASFYRHHPPINEDILTAEIPRPLFELAEALLKRNCDLSSLYRLVDLED